MSFHGYIKEELESGEIVDYDEIPDYRQQYEYNEKVQEEVEEERFFCTVCNHTSNSWESYQEHVVSQTHVERAARVFHLEVPTKKQIKEERRDKEVYHCDICDVNCNGDINWNAHLAGSKHQKREKQRKLEDGVNRAAADKVALPGGPVVHDEAITQQDFIDYPDPLIGLEYVTEIQIPGEPPCFYCELCDARFSNNLKFAHVTGSKHRYKVIKERDPVWARSIQESSERRSDLTQRLVNAARRLENQYGRQRIKARVEAIPKFNIPSFKDGSSYHKDGNGKNEEPWYDRGRKNQDRYPDHKDVNTKKLPSLMDKEIPAAMFMDGSRKGEISKSFNNNAFPNNFPRINRGLDNVCKELNEGKIPAKTHPEKSYRKEHSERSLSRERRNQSSRSYKGHSDRSRSRERGRTVRSPSRERKPFIARGRSPGRGQATRDLSEDRNNNGIIADPRKRSRSRETRRSRSRDRGRLYQPPQRRNRSRSPYSRVRSPKQRSPVDISEEIEKERKRQERRAEEKRRAEERRKRHEEREKKEKQEEEEKRKKEVQIKKEPEDPDEEGRIANKPRSPPPRAPAVLDEDTKRLVMQNLTELAKCCVTNEADAELALQVSNALTQALLQYRMKNMPESVLQSLNVSELAPPPPDPICQLSQSPTVNAQIQNNTAPLPNSMEPLGTNVYNASYQPQQQRQSQPSLQQFHHYQQQDNSFYNNVQQQALPTEVELPPPPPRFGSESQTFGVQEMQNYPVKTELTNNFHEQSHGLLQQQVAGQQQLDCFPGNPAYR